MIRYVLLDLDDTILDFHQAEAEALKDTLRHFDIVPSDGRVALYSRINDAQWKLLEKGELTREQVKLRRFQLFFEELGVDCSAEDARVYYETRLAIGHYFLPGAEQMLANLAARYELYLVSNGTTAVQNGRVKSAGIAPLFRKIFFSEAIGYVKPQKEFFDICFAEIPGFDPEKAIIIGDSLTSDILGGIHAGIRTCWFNPKGAVGRKDIVPDFEIRALEEFVPLLEKL